MILQGIIARGPDGYFHPSDEDEVIALVKHAAANKRQIRVRGDSHSTAWSIFTDPVDGEPPNKTLNRRPRSGPNLDLAMDRMNRLTWIDEANGIVEAEAGTHLGADPYDAIGAATLENSLLFQLLQKGWGINDLGGITHQTISGFTATGSSGGSLKFDMDNVAAVRIVDGTGTASWIDRGEPDLRRRARGRAGDRGAFGQDAAGAGLHRAGGSACYGCWSARTTAPYGRHPAIVGGLRLAMLTLNRRIRPTRLGRRRNLAGSGLRRHGSQATTPPHPLPHPARQQP